MSAPWTALGRQESFTRLDHEMDEMFSERSSSKHAYYSEQENDAQTHYTLNASSTERFIAATRPDRRLSTSTPPFDNHDSMISSENHEVAARHYRTDVTHIIPGHKLRDRVGTYLVYMNVGALILLFGSISALCFLWFGGQANVQWRHVMINGWIGQAVTLCSIAIRLALATQATTAVSMIAGITMESNSHGGVSLRDAPALSIARYTNPGPLVLLPTLLQNAWSTKRFLVSAITFVLAFTTLIAQFTSTLLLWDVRTSVTHGFPRSTNVTVGIDMEGLVERFKFTMALAEDYWVSSQTFVTFAEWNKQPLDLPDSIVDTGPTVRAFLPLASAADRAMLREYEGLASVFDARVACVRPTFDNWSLNSSYGRTTITGSLHAASLTDDLQQILRYNQSNSGMNFSCLFDDLDTLIDPMFKICSLSYTEGGLINQLDPTSNSTLEYRFGSEDNHKHTNDLFKHMSWVALNNGKDETWPVELGHTFLILGSRGNTTDIAQSGFFNPPPHGPNLGNFTLKDRGPWVEFSTNGPSGANVTKKLSVTLCYDALPNPRDADGRLKHVQDFPIKATRLFNQTDPVLEWNPSRRAFNTTSVRIHLGATANLSAQTRGVFDLDMSFITNSLDTLTQQWSPNHNISFNDMRNSETLWFLNTDLALPEDRSYTNNSLPSFSSAPHGTYDYLNTLLFWRLMKGNENAGHKHIILHPMLNAIFQDTLLETENPALAYQALITTIIGTAYYDWIPVFDIKEKMTTVSMIACQLPLYSKGFAITIANIFLHLVLVAITTVWFARTTDYSLLNNSWQAVAQLQGPRTEKLMQESTMSNDTMVKKDIEDQGPEIRRRVWLQKTEGGRVCMS